MAVAQWPSKRVEVAGKARNTKKIASYSSQLVERIENVWFSRCWRTQSDRWSRWRLSARELRYKGRALPEPQ